jgi:capsular exopolysaccharide synthesis family protein
MATEPTPGQPQDSGPSPGQPSPNLPVPRAARHAAPPAALSTPPNAVALLKALRRRWPLALGLGLLLAALLGPGTWLLLPPSKHFVRTLIYLPPPRAVVPGFAVHGASNLDAHQRTQVALVKSRLVLNAALRNPDVAHLGVILAQPEPVEWMEGSVQADFAQAPDILRIHMSGENPDELRTIVDAVCKAFLKEVVEREENQCKDKQEMLAGIRKRFESRLKDAKETQKTLVSRGATKDAFAQALILNFFQQQLGRVDSELGQIDADLRKAGLELAEEKEREKNLNTAKVPGPTLDAAVSGSEEVKKLEALLQAHEQRIRKFLLNAAMGEKDPIIVGWREDQQKTKDALAALKRELRPAFERAMRETAAAEISANTARLQRRIDFLIANKKVLDKEQQGQRQKIAEKMAAGAALDDVKEDVAQIEELIKRVQNQELALDVQLNAPKREQLLEPAIIYLARSKSRQAMMAGGAAGAGLVLAILAVALWEFRARRVDTVDQVAQGLGLRVVGALPDSSRPVRRLWWSHDNSAEAYSAALLTESIDATRTMLLHASRMGSVQVLLVTSAMPGEGKTSLASHLAASLARSGLKTLLIDGDLRNPTAHLLFELPNGPGFCALLRGEARPAEVTVPTAVPGLWFLSAGNWCGLSAQGLAQNRNRVVLGQLRRDYDFIVIDSSPVLPVTDALLLGQSVDAAVLSILRDVSRLPNVYTASQRLSAVGVQILGAVVNGVPGEFSAAPYKYVGGTTTAPDANAPEGNA